MMGPTRDRQLRMRDDSGASLVLALVMVTVFSIIVAAVLTFADTSLRTTMVLRDQAADAAGADGAADIAVNALRHGYFDGSAGGCFGPSDNTLELREFYQPRTGAATSAAVVCEEDAARSGPMGDSVPPAIVPPQALLTLATAGQTGLDINTGGRDVRVQGDVFANSTINVTAGSLTGSAGVRAVGACTGTGTVTAAPPPECPSGLPAMAGPGYRPPVETTVLNTPPDCGANPTDALEVFTFSPGRYTDLDGLNGLDRCTTPILYFKAGTYYFNFTSMNDEPWTIRNAYVVGGTAPDGQPPVHDLVPALPGWCQSPVPPTPYRSSWPHPAPDLGVRFVFGGNSRIRFENSQVELCGDYSATEPPIVLHGLRTAVAGIPIPAQDGCITEVPYSAPACSVIATDNGANSRLHIQGTTFLPVSTLDISVNNRRGPVFADGVIARSLRLAPTAGANLSEPVVARPTGSGRQTVVHLVVYLCPGASTCTTATGTVRLRAKVGIGDPTGAPVAGSREVTVLSWSGVRQ